MRLWKEVTSRGVKILARVKGNLILEPIRNLADGSYLAKIYRTPERPPGRIAMGSWCG